MNAERKKPGGARVSSPAAGAMKRVHQLSDIELERHLRVFLERIGPYIDVLGIGLEWLESLRKEQLAFSWLQEMNRKLNDYNRDIACLQRLMKQKPGQGALNLLRFYDLPRPPLFYPQGDVVNLFCKIVTIVKASGQYTAGIGRDLGIENLAGGDAFS